MNRESDFPGRACIGIPRARRRTALSKLSASFVLASALTVAGGAVRAQPAALTIQEALTLAVERDPGLMRRQANAASLRQEAVADGQLPDPQLKLGAVNFPADTLSRTQEPMTQVLLGLQQAFPPGRTLPLRRLQTEARAVAEDAAVAEERLAVARDVRQAWLELHYQLQTAEVLDDTEAVFAELVGITEAYYASGRRNQQDVLRAQLELSRLEDRQTEIAAGIDQARADLAKWVGQEAALRPLAKQATGLPEPANLPELRQKLQHHPLLLVEDARVEEAQLGVDLARQQYKPGWRVELAYGLRGGNNLDGNDRPDFVSGMLMMDLPIFPGNRQDRRLAAGQERRQAALASREDRYRELLRELEATYAAWQRLDERRRSYRETLLVRARQNADASLVAFQSDVTDFTTLMRARITQLDTRLQAERIEVDYSKTQVGLLYLSGEAP